MIVKECSHFVIRRNTIDGSEHVGKPESVNEEWALFHELDRGTEGVPREGEVSGQFVSKHVWLWEMESHVVESERIGLGQPLISFFLEFCQLEFSGSSARVLWRITRTFGRLTADYESSLLGSQELAMGVVEWMCFVEPEDLVFWPARVFLK